MNPESTNPQDDARGDLPVSAEDLLAYVEGSLTGEEFFRVQAAICARESDYRRMLDVRRQIYERLPLDSPLSFEETAALLEEAEIAASAEAPLASHPSPATLSPNPARPMENILDDFVQWCAAVGAEVVAGIQVIHGSLKCMHSQDWRLGGAGPARPRLGSSATRSIGAPKSIEPEPRGESRISLEKLSDRLEFEWAGAAIIVTLRLDSSFKGPIAAMRMVEENGVQKLVQCRGSGYLWPDRELIRFELQCEPGPNHFVIQALTGERVERSWAFVVASQS